jgi:hypothetical protein
MPTVRLASKGVEHAVSERFARIATAATTTARSAAGNVDNYAGERTGQHHCWKPSLLFLLRAQDPNQRPLCCLHDNAPTIPSIIAIGW